MTSLERQEQEMLWELGEVAQKLGVLIGVENARPYLDGSPYCYAERLDLLAERIASIGHPHIRITLDLGHAYLAAHFYGFDLIEAVRSLAPLVCHLHVHDNFGRSCGSLEKKQVELLATGRGDLHLPLGWGDLPLKETLTQLAGYRGILVQELRPRYRAYFEASLRYCRELVGSIEFIR